MEHTAAARRWSRLRTKCPNLGQNCHNEVCHISDLSSGPFVTPWQCPYFGTSGTPRDAWPTNRSKLYSSLLHHFIVSKRQARSPANLGRGLHEHHGGIIRAVPDPKLVWRIYGTTENAGYGIWWEYWIVGDGRHDLALTSGRPVWTRWAKNVGDALPGTIHKTREYMHQQNLSFPINFYKGLIRLVKSEIVEFLQLSL